MVVRIGRLKVPIATGSIHHRDTEAQRTLKLEDCCSRYDAALDFSSRVSVTLW